MPNEYRVKINGPKTFKKYANSMCGGQNHWMPWSNLQLFFSHSLFILFCSYSHAEKCVSRNGGMGNDVASSTRLILWASVATGIYQEEIVVLRIAVFWSVCDYCSVNWQTNSVDNWQFSSVNKRLLCPSHCTDNLYIDSANHFWR